MKLRRIPAELVLRKDPVIAFDSRPCRYSATSWRLHWNCGNGPGSFVRDSIHVIVLVVDPHCARVQSLFPVRMDDVINPFYPHFQVFCVFASCVDLDSLSLVLLFRFKLLPDTVV